MEPHRRDGRAVLAQFFIRVNLTVVVNRQDFRGTAIITLPQIVLDRAVAALESHR